jgi:RNA polymerase sigma factor (TIGR02999 family)
VSVEDPARLFNDLYAELRKIARARMSKLPPGDTLQPTALVHEAFLRLASSSGQWQSQAHFFATASRAMWQILADRAREKRSLKRGGGAPRSSLEERDQADDPMVPGLTADDLLALDRALERMGKETRRGQIVLLRFIAGFTIEEVASALEVSVRTVEREWHVARLFLYTELEEERREMTT